jgi:hypothetical protein
MTDRAVAFTMLAAGGGVCVILSVLRGSSRQVMEGERPTVASLVWRSGLAGRLLLVLGAVSSLVGLVGVVVIAIDALL